ncbi:MAG TPA: hypothetical protein DDX91_09315 [Ruminococcaceae bacterium]|nr:hypothetical protein [Oscillospiraceae bacterium]
MNSALFFCIAVLFWYPFLFCLFTILDVEPSIKVSVKNRSLGLFENKGNAGFSNQNDWIQGKNAAKPMFDEDS